MIMSLATCCVSLTTGDVSDFEILEDEVEVDDTEYVLFKTQQFLDSINNPASH